MSRGFLQHCSSQWRCCLLGLLLATQAATIYGAQQVIDEASRLAETDPESAIALLGSTIGSTGDTDDRGNVGLLAARASFYRDLGEYDRARIDITRARQLLTANDDPVRIARILRISGSIEAESGSPANALALFHEAHALLEPTDAIGDLGWTTNAIGMAHNFLGSKERARNYFDRALTLARQANEADLEIIALGNLAVAVAAIDGPEAGITLHEEALSLAEARGAALQAGYQLANICHLQVESGQPQPAAGNCRKALDYLLTTGQPRILAGIFMTLGDLERGRGRLDDALEHYLAALDIASRTVPTVHLELLEKLADTHLRLQQPTEAADYLKRLLALREGARQREQDELTEELEARFELRQAEDKIDLLQLNALLAQEQLERRNLLLGITAAILLTALIFVILITRAYRARSVLQHELSSRNRELQGAVDTIRELAAKDPLTGLFNRRAFLEISRHARARCQRDNLPMSLTMADIDEFKELNDTYGHQIGDEVLTEVAQRIQKTLRNSDIVFRWGGEEFLCLHPATDLETAAKVIERVRQALERKPILTSGGKMTMTMTFGISAIGEDITAAIQGADNAMYEGKRSGRNRIMVSKQSPDKEAEPISVE
ncbi:hypothetical protein CWI75_05115 [Kineobactrum sediminis]|uniref:diguanylate cyclase n=1 Tax=Kineobactrum sediminis TaxID=1905677 RepID=A0A2N5Y5P8_9GAMM|nr:diguanylate cyclase [Kineobactrum sediminis]PLW83725.1 hypothetical protein CWI75_05115 [Kineobactrum sediminis]